MRVRFWGTRGSLPVALTAGELRAKIAAALLAADGRRFDDADAAQAFAGSLPFSVGGTYGGHSPCMEIEPGPDDADYVLCDLGSGVRAFGNRVLATRGRERPQRFHVFMSHVHWDHIMGFPFFAPAYIPGNIIHIYGCHDELESAFRRQQAAPSFPVDFDALHADIRFVRLEPERRHEIAGMGVTAKVQRHAGDSYGWRFERAGRSIVYSTDSEHKLDDAAETRGFADFFRGADLVVFDAMYSLADAISVKEDWGHSSNMIGVELCQMAGAKHLVLFHHEPVFSDERIEQVFQETLRYEEITRGAAALRISCAYDGLEIEL